ncbi:MAG: putative carbonic anhydrase [Candidatus Xenolissoclinum pacificiensis L6]|uniref:carbonic anhydrase n=1 Tax=Candidatus Xenolissoclinum pacificiensis L6 TaxID=1401685 RepID=W2V0Z9_9RICK|nr:MAG: putative carbonic anhydrase [Candidatus Xenolissoclinum pacificiensis L6]
MSDIYSNYKNHVLIFTLYSVILLVMLISQNSYATSTNKNQSPINIMDAYLLKAKLPSLELNYQGSITGLYYDGKSLNFSMNEQNFIIINDKKFVLKNIHFHAPAEHKINGKSYDVEGHFVHEDHDGNIAVIGVLFKSGKKANATFEKILAEIPTSKGQKITISKPIAISDLLSSCSMEKYYTYSGSLTTPPFSEGVLWIVLEDVIDISSAQYKKIKQVHKKNNAREIQPLNARFISCSL